MVVAILMVVVVVGSLASGFSSRGALFRIGIRLGLMGMRTVDDVGGNMAVNETGDEANDDNTGEEETDEGVCGGTSGPAGFRQVVLGGGQHAVQRGEEHNTGTEAQRGRQEAIVADDLEVLAVDVAQDEVSANDGRAHDAGYTSSKLVCLRKDGASRTKRLTHARNGAHNPASKVIAGGHGESCRRKKAGDVRWPPVAATRLQRKTNDTPTPRRE